MKLLIGAIVAHAISIAAIGAFLFLVGSAIVAAIAPKPRILQERPELPLRWDEDTVRIAKQRIAQRATDDRGDVA